MEILNSIQREILNIFGAAEGSKNFYLTGGTALSAFYLKHRKSNDLDFFTSVQETIIPFSYGLEGVLKSRGISTQRQRGTNSFVELLAEKHSETMIIHLAQDSPFHLEKTRYSKEFPNLRIDSLIDIASNKLLALFSRATLRDFIDVYCLVKKAKITQDELIDKARMKDPGFDLYWLGVALERINTFSENSSGMLLLIESVNFKDLLVFFNQWREKIARELKGH